VRLAALLLVILLGGCAAALLPVIAGALGAITGAEQIVAAKEQAPPQPEPPALDGSWTPP
jgi:hypothetical protein